MRRPHATRSRNRRAALTLVVLTPLVAELALGSTPIRMAWLVILWVPIYGAGVLAVRELVVRCGRGWPSILLMALAYELLEDGLGLQALTSPHLYDAADWGLRVFGFNAPYWEANVVYHAVFTLAIPIAVTDLLFPLHRGRPYLGRTGLVVSGLVALLGVGVLRGSVPPQEDRATRHRWGSSSVASSSCWCSGSSPCASSRAPSVPRTTPRSLPGPGCSAAPRWPRWRSSH